MIPATVDERRRDVVWFLFCVVVTLTRLGRFSTIPHVFRGGFGEILVGCGEVLEWLNRAAC